MTHPPRSTPAFPPPRPIAKAKSAFVLAFAALAALAGPSAGADATTRAEQLLVFSRSADSPVSQQFAEQHLPALREQARRLGIEIEEIDVARAGAPADIHLTPLIVYQSPRGRAFFQGRYVDTGKVAHFVRTQRAVPPASGSFEATDAAVAELGRARVLAPIKVTALAGQAPEQHDAAAFEERARDAIMSGFERFERRASATLGPSDRSFYMDFHPYRSEDGRLFVSTALFSQFNCIEPVFTAFDQPVSGSWDAWTDVFSRAARQLEDAALEKIRRSEIGDGFDGVPATLAAPSWQALGLELPEMPAGSAAVDVDVELPDRWRIEGAVDGGAPRLIFRFPPPLDRYSGEVAEIDGELSLEAPERVDGARGFVLARTSSVTMGEDSLDNAVRGKMIFVDRFPEARFELEHATADQPLAFGRISRMVAQGTFSMMGIEIPLDVRAQLEPIIGDDGAPRLHVQAGFDIRLESPFGIAGPDGPAPANDTLDFHLDVLLEAAGSSGDPGASTADASTSAD